jgi:hypothetical protein
VTQNSTQPPIGNLYTIPSGMGGVFDVRVLALYEARRRGDGTSIPPSIHLRVDMPRNPDWHGYTVVMERDYFEQVAVRQ